MNCEPSQLRGTPAKTVLRLAVRVVTEFIRFNSRAGEAREQEGMTNN
ncbi:hypothetical protein [Nostoc sp.]